MPRTHVFCVELLFWSIQRFAPSRALLLAMGICKRTLERESDDACGICNEPLDDRLVDTADAKVYDSCSHKFHRSCMDTYMDARGVSEDQVQCPQCEIGQASLEITKWWLRNTSPKSDAAKPMQPADAVEVCAAQSAPALLGPPTPKAESSRPLVPVMEEMLGDRPQVTLDLGPSSVSKEEVEQIVASLESDWEAKDYHVFDKNCVHFADTLGAKVVEGGVPRPLLQGVLDVSERMLDSLPEWRMKLGRRVMNEVTRLVVVSWGKASQEKKEATAEKLGLEKGA